MAILPERVWFITGISRGLGRSLAEAVLAGGDTVIGTSRSGQADLSAPPGRLDMLRLDVTDADQVTRAVQAAHRIHGRLDVVVNNAGYGLLGAVEEADRDEIHAVFDTNLFGAVHVIRAALPLLRGQREGRIVNISSIAAIAPAAGSGYYAAAKAALTALTASLAQEVEPLGIRVTSVEPGAFRTDFLSPSSVRITEDRIPAYAQTSGAALDHLRSMAGRQLGDPAKAAALIVEAVRQATPPLHLLIGADAVDRARASLAQITGDLDTWELRARATSLSP
jgi:NAD(P)-dependent dehydrogenase (short-subunit alcohol dehydrogenase family)